MTRPALHPTTSKKHRIGDILLLSITAVLVIQIVLVLLRITGVIGWDWNLVMIPLFVAMAATAAVSALLFVGVIFVGFVQEVAASAMRVFSR